MATRAIWTDCQMLEVLTAESLCRSSPSARLSIEWIVRVADYAMACEGIERTGSKRHLTVPITRRRLLRLARRMDNSSASEPSTTTPEDTLRAAGISTKRQARYQRRMSSLLAGRSDDA